jgi:hypothetical protein
MPHLVGLEEQARHLQECLDQVNQLIKTENEKLERDRAHLLRMEDDKAAKLKRIADEKQELESQIAAALAMPESSLGEKHHKIVALKACYRRDPRPELQTAFNNLCKCK